MGRGQLAHREQQQNGGGGRLVGELMNLSKREGPNEWRLYPPQALGEWVVYPKKKKRKFFFPREKKGGCINWGRGLFGEGGDGYKQPDI